MIFCSRSVHPDAVPAPAGSRYKQEYRLAHVDGDTTLVEDGYTDLLELHNSYKDEVDIINLIKRSANGDVNALAARHGSYLDTTEMPTTLAEMYHLSQLAADELARIRADLDGTAPEDDGSTPDQDVKESDSNG